MTSIPLSDEPRGSTNSSVVTPDEDARTTLINKIGWGAVIAGVVITLVAQIFLNMLGVGIGAATLDVASGETPSGASSAIGAGLWFGVSAILAALAGGYAAGRLSGKPAASTAGWHGLIAWALSTLVVLYLLTSAVGGILGGAYRGAAGAIGGAANAAGSTVQTAAQVAAPNMGQAGDAFSSIQNSMQSAAGGQDPAAMKDAAISAVRSAVTGDQAQAAQAKDRAAQAIARSQNIPIEEARTQVDQYYQQYRQTMERTKQQAVEAADVAAKGASRGALFGAFALLLGALAGWFGGRIGAVDPTLTAARPGPSRARGA